MSRPDDGVVALEVALLVPLVGLLMLAVVLAGVHAVDHISVQDAARAGARAAATSRADDPVTRAAMDAAGGRSVQVRVDPPDRRPGTAATVVVTFSRNVGWIRWTVTGSAVAVVEPGA